MEELFAPWRIEWVERDDDAIDGCPFCVLPDREDDRDSRILARSPRSFVVLNNAPYSPGHAMVIPYAHEGEYQTLPAATVADHARTKQATFRAIQRGLDPDGLNAGMNHGSGSAAGGSIGEHLHTHVVPRWDGDTNFMPVIADTQVIVEAIDETYDRLRAAFRELAVAREPPHGDAAVPLRFESPE